MKELSKELQEKHALGISAAMNYYVYNQPTGVSDFDYDLLEEAARKDGFELRDYATQFIQGKRVMNADYITKVEKSKVTGNMLEAIRAYQQENPEISYWLPKYDGSSLAAYYDPLTGKCKRVVTVGGTNLGAEGIDQTEKFVRYFPDLPGSGVVALHCECLVALEHGLGESSRQKANGLVCCSYVPLDKRDSSDKEYSNYLRHFSENFEKMREEVDQLITIRCFRYYTEDGKRHDQRAFLDSLPAVLNQRGDIKFCGGFTFTTPEAGEFVNSDIWKTDTGTFLVDGVVGYTADGTCVRALKYASAGIGESTEVLGIKWNDQSKKGKDSWSANALVNPVYIRGAEIKKPSVGSVQKMVDTGLSKGAKVTVILANSTIPQVSQVLKPGNLDFEWPTCGCGYTLGPTDIFGALVKCGNPKCTERLGRMRAYLKTVIFGWPDLNKLLVIDRFDWTKKADLTVLWSELEPILKNDFGIERFVEALGKWLSPKSTLQRRNLELVAWPAYNSLREWMSTK